MGNIRQKIDLMGGEFHGFGFFYPFVPQAVQNKEIIHQRYGEQYQDCEINAPGDPGSIPGMADADSKSQWIGQWFAIASHAR